MAIVFVVGFCVVGQRAGCELGTDVVGEAVDASPANVGSVVEAGGEFGAGVGNLGAGVVGCWVFGGEVEGMSVVG